MVNVDTVYQRVLALANKEQRGYITPQEFNLFANQAQMDIFEQYFYDINQFGRVPGNNTLHSDPLDILEDKLDIFHTKSILSGADNVFDIPNSYYRHIALFTVDNSNVQKLSIKEAMQVSQGPLTSPTLKRPIYYIDNNNRINILPETITNGSFHYYRKPEKVNWTYVVVGEKALSNPNALDYQDFELHPSEETKLVIKTLGLAGITLKDPALYQTATAEDNKNIQQEKQ
jgi:hypothetical protein